MTDSADAACAPQPLWTGWAPNYGSGECPIPWAEHDQWRAWCRDGSICRPINASYVNWRHTGREWDIVAYSVREEFAGRLSPWELAAAKAGVRP